MLPLLRVLIETRVSNSEGGRPSHPMIFRPPPIKIDAPHGAPPPTPLKNEAPYLKNTLPPHPQNET